MTGLLLTVMVWLGVAWQSAATQSSQAEPVRAGRPFVAELEHYATLSFNLTNTSSKTIAGCRVLSKILKQGRIVGDYGYTRVDLAGVGNMGPGQVVPVELHIGKEEARGLTESDIRIAVDYVVFEDGTTWGPDTEKLGRAIKAEISGARAERRRLKMLLTKYGPQKVVEELERPYPLGSAW